MVDDFNPESDEPVTGRPERPDTATDTETEQASNLKDDIDDLNQVCCLAALLCCLGCGPSAQRSQICVFTS